MEKEKYKSKKGNACPLSHPNAALEREMA